MGFYMMIPFLNMFIFSNVGGVIADHLITNRILSVTGTRKFLNTIGFVVASVALVAIPIFHTSGGAVFCSSMALGFLALGRAGFAVNHLDIDPRYAGIVMGVSNTAGTLAGIIGVDFTGRLLEAAKTDNSDLESRKLEISVHDTGGALHHQLTWIFITLNWREDFRLRVDCSSGPLAFCSTNPLIKVKSVKRVLTPNPERRMYSIDSF
ncbi:hypothetical protein SO802_027773 [Lithocarpus litseifolius]|uniref:Uncharacterized protein n=1 Tax=Lithocarpus litseifolius TaxID=425828 RepID=A0AAW2BNH0_9ROSI